MGHAAEGALRASQLWPWSLREAGLRASGNCVKIMVVLRLRPAHSQANEQAALRNDMAQVFVAPAQEEAFKRSTAQAANSPKTTRGMPRLV